MLRKLLVKFLLILLALPSFAGEGMWIPMLIEKYNITDMQSKGLKISAEDIYSLNQSCLKDAVVLFGRGCTGEIVSGSGLLLTNHHCGYGVIQSHSSVENDYLTHGFWAMSLEEELPNPSLSVKFLVRMEDVTSDILSGINEGMTPVTRNELVRRNIDLVRKKKTEGTNYSAEVESFYYGNEYYLFIYEEFRDVRLVGAPPSQIGNFGEDTDNWIWPRHTGDFSVFRVYAGPDNKPADYSPDNIPYKPRKFLNISMKGIEVDSFTMVMGYPARTFYYYTSDALTSIQKTYPKKIALRDTRMEIMARYMKTSDEVRIQYASKYRSVSNSWKKWKGVVYGFEANDAIELRRKSEENFNDWVNADTERVKLYSSVLPGLKEVYSDLDKYDLVYEYAAEAVTSPEIIDFAIDVYGLFNNRDPKADTSPETISTKLRNLYTAFFKDYYESIDREILAAMLGAYRKDIAPEFHPLVFGLVDRKYKGDFVLFADRLFDKTILNSPAELESLAALYSRDPGKALNKLDNDPVVSLYREFIQVYGQKIYPAYSSLNNRLEELYRTYLRGMREMETDRHLHPDANFTMRVAYGKAEGYNPSDGVSYDYYSTIDGIIEKAALGYADYNIPVRLRELHKNSDYGPYADSDGNLRVCFIASNHTSGGNSGSPVMNGRGELIGLNFDRNWEGTMGDFIFDENYCRNIAVDIRYVLFIIDKYAGAGYLLNELNLVY